MAMRVRNPWETGEKIDGVRVAHWEVASRLNRVKTMAEADLRAAILWPDTQKAVRVAAERRLRKMEKSLKDRLAAVVVQNADIPGVIMSYRRIIGGSAA
jgi:hypothetical protein